MNVRWKKVLLLLFIVLIDFAVVLLMRLLTPKIFLLRMSIIAVIIAGSMLCYYFFVRPADWIKESIFSGLVLALLSLILTVVLHRFIENNLTFRHLIVTAAAFILPFLSGGLYRIITVYKKDGNNE